MAGRGPRTPRQDLLRQDLPRHDSPRDASREARTDPHGTRDEDPGAPFGADASLVRIRDLAGRPRGAGFVADHHGTVLTSHETVDGLSRLVVCAAGDRSCVVSADAVTPLPELDLALVRTDGLGADPLPMTVREGVEPGRYVRLAAGCWREARVLAETPVMYTAVATDRSHVLDGALELAIGTAGRDALRPAGGASGGPVLDAATGAVVGVLGTALRSGPRDTGFAVTLRPAPPSPPGDVPASAEGPAGGPAALSRETRHGYGTGAGVGNGYRGAGSGGGVGGAVDAGSVHAPATRVPDGGSPRGEGGAGSVPAQAEAGGPLAELLARNAATVPAYGADLNLAGVLELTATSVASDGPAGALSGCLGGTAGGSRPAATAPVERAQPAREFAAFAVSPAAVLGLVGAPGSGRTTELAALAARRYRASDQAPTLWLRGADLRADDDSLADAVRRTLARAARIVAAGRSTPRTAVPGPSHPPGTAGTARAAESVSEGSSGSGGSGGSGGAGPGDVTPERLARLARAAGRPLLLLLDGPEEMPPVLTHRLADWTEGTAHWLRETGARLVVACRPEYWERAGAQFPPGTLYGTAAVSGPLPPCVRLGDLTPEEAREARARYAVPESALAAPDDRHPLTLRLFSEIRAALPGGAARTPGDRTVGDRLPADLAPLDRDDVFAAHLDLMCLRIAVRIAVENGLRGAAVRRLAVKVSGQVHEAARRSLGPGQGQLDRASFEAVFPWGPAPARLGGGSGWASAVLTEGLLVPAGSGYRFAHEELADWIQGLHLDLDEALRALVHRPADRAADRPDAPGGDRPLPVPHHRIGPVIQALLLLGRHQGPPQLAARLRELISSLEADPGSWWAARLLAETLLRVPDATPYTGVLRLLADRIGAGLSTGADVAETGAPIADFGPGFWTRLALPCDARLDLLRRLVLADGAPHAADAPRYLDVVAGLLAADPAAVQPHLTHWFDDERPLPATPHATVATAAQALLHTHRRRALDDLTDVLVDCAHHRAAELLAVLAEEEPSALCRAVDRWAHDERPARRVAAVVHALRAAPRVAVEADRRLLRHAALDLLARPADGALHGGALALLVLDPETRPRHLARALERFAAVDDPYLPPGALLPALSTAPGPVLDAFRARLLGSDRAAAGRILRTLADVTTPSAPARRIAVLVQEAGESRPECAGHVAAYVDRRLDHGPDARPVVLPLVTGLLADGSPEPVRAALAGVLAAPGAPGSRPLRDELLEHLLAREQAPAVLYAVLYAAAGRDGEDLRDLVQRIGRLVVRTPEGATCFDRGLVDLGRHVPGFAARAVEWLTEAPGEWAGVVGPSARRALECLAGSGSGAGSGVGAGAVAGAVAGSEPESASGAGRV
ncbi:serine protease [Streptomyces sp. ME08-AFT2]|uniref:trypsin-like peptidase domain-containing protein n=1 Tax=Streptomyces sp. ME08-AFT2 TaxID=3028683 RepID=UPI0029B7B6AE|nr:trypsin-like peptidase domain-containing protein [Streptomyces sp. ME08-AFT2]MDX3315131.1 serine protease [Streptomyces sp. ME08-AFT2]